MGSNSFAPFQPQFNRFIVKNVAQPPKVVRIFNYPINSNDTRDILRIPGISESDIRVSLIKGEINHKLRSVPPEIKLIESDIDLLQFNQDNRNFLVSAGFSGQDCKGVDGSTIIMHNDGTTLNTIISGGGVGGLTEDQHDALHSLIHFISDGPTDGFASGSVKVILPIASPFPTSIIWFANETLTTKLVEKLITYNINSQPAIETWNMYGDNNSIIHTVQDTITYTDNIFEYQRVRTIS